MKAKANTSNSKKLLSVFLAVMLVFTCGIPFTAFADDEVITAEATADDAAEIGNSADEVTPDEVITDEFTTDKPIADEDGTDEITADELAADEIAEDETPADETANANDKAVAEKVFSSKSAEVESTLQNFWLLLNDESVQDIKVAYLGGSITNGSNASPINQYSWRGRVGSWLVDNYGPGTAYNKNIENVNAGIGATGSYFGAYRLYDDAEFADGVPDLLFIEFGVNDIYDGLKEAKHGVELNYESIIRQAYKANPEMTVVTVFTMDNNIAANIIKDGNDTNSSYHFRAQRNVADYYGLPQMNVGMNFVNDYIKAPHDEAGTSFSASNYTKDSFWTKYIADACHPNNEGHAIYAGYITDYFAEQLGDGVGHSENVKVVNIDEVTPYVASFGDGAEKHLKENGRRISFKDAGFTQDDVNGWTLATTNNESSKSSSNGVITTNRANASFAFKFTGTSVGFYNQGMPSSGTLNYTITSTADSSEKYTGSVSLVKGYPTGLPYPAELITGLDEKEWLVECVIVPGDNGCYGELRYIYINGDTASVSPAKAPETALQKVPPIFVPYTSSTHMTNQKDNNSKFGEIKTIDGITGKAVLKGDDNRTVWMENYSYHSLTEKISFPDYTHVGVTYYFDDNGVTDSKVKNTAFTMCQVYSGGKSSGWLPGSNGFPGVKSASAVKGKWVTQYFDFSDFAQKAGELYPGSVLYQAKPAPYGTISANDISNEILYFNSTIFSGGAPLIYNEDGTQSLINDGNQIAYVSSTGAVALNGKTYEAYYSIADAVNALSPVGGTIKVSGSELWSDGAVERGKITIEGVDSDSLITNTSIVVTNGDLELKNIKIKGHSDEYWSRTNGHKLILGEGFNSGAGIRPASAGGKPTNADIYSGTVRDFAAMAGYNQKFTVTGNAEYNIYGGNVSSISGISRNGLDSTNYQTFNGNITYNIFGGTLNSITTATTTGVLNGNLFVNISGGNFSKSSAIVFGSSQSAPTKGLLQIDGNVAYIINSKEIKAAKGTLAGATIGTTQNPVGGVHNKIVIINNNELSSETGAAISEKAAAEYQLLVNNGKAVPVIDETNKLLGFRLIPDIDGRTPYIIGGDYLTPDDDGIYSIESAVGVTRTIDFAALDGFEITFSDGASASYNMAVSKNEVIKMPSCTQFAKSGYAFAGWKTEGDDRIYIPGDEYNVGESTAIFTAQWTAQNDIAKVYVKASAETLGTGLSAESPVNTINKAITLGGTDRDFEIVILDYYKTGSYQSHTAHTGTITFTAQDENGIISYPDQLALGGPVIIQNITLELPSGYHFIEPRGAKLVMGEGIILKVTNPSYGRIGVHLGKSNSDTSYQYGEFLSGNYGSIYVGTYYNQASTQKISDGARIAVDGADISNITFGPDGYSGNNGPAKWTNSPSLVFNSGKIGKINKGSCSVAFEKPVQIILNGGTELPAIELGSPAPEMIIIRTFGAIHADVTEISGVFKINTELESFLIDGILTEKSADGLYELGVGEHIIADGAEQKISFSASSADTEGSAPEALIGRAGSEAVLPENTFTRQGFEFAGWYNADENKVYEAGSKFVIPYDSKELSAMWKNADANRSFLATEKLCGDYAIVDLDGDGVYDTYAQKAFTAALDAISDKTGGGTVYVCGNANASIGETANSRGPVLVRGWGDDVSANSFNANIDTCFNKNDITFDYITFNGPDNERFISIVNNYTLTIGENVAVVSINGTRKLYIGAVWSTSTEGNYVMSGGEYSYVMSGGNYKTNTQTGSTHTGDIRMTFNGGTFNEVYGGSRNGNGADDAGRNTVNANVYYTFNGGVFNNNIYLGSHYCDSVKGNIIFTVNGGDYKQGIIAGHRTFGSETNKTDFVCGGDNVVIFNSASIGENDNVASLTLGKAGSGLAVGGDEIYIINNAEIPTGAKIHAESTAAYKIRVNGGNAKPVYAEGTGVARLGFEIVSDKFGYIPTVGGKKLEKNANGYYDLVPNNTAGGYIDIAFVRDGCYVDIGGNPVKVSETESGIFTVTAPEEGVVNFKTYPYPEKDGELFLGWYNTDGSAVENGSVLAKDTVITAKYHKFVTNVNSSELGFGVLGAQIRLSGDPALRFVNKFSLDIRSALAEINADIVPNNSEDKGIGYGFVILPEKLLGDSKELSKDTARSAIVPAVKIFDEKDGYILYTVCLTNVLETNYNENYTVRPYITYNDAQSIEHTVYGEQYATNMAAIAGMALDNESNKLTDEQKTALTAIAGR